MLFVLINEGDIFVLAASRYSCDRRTAPSYHGRMLKCTNVADIRRALTDKPRQGRPTKIPKKLLADAEKWCSRAFTPMELQSHLKKISGVELGMSRTRYYAKKWKNSCKKTSPVHVNRAPLGDVQAWKRSIIPKASWYTRQKYAIATMDESNFKDGMLSRRFWAGIGTRIFMLWSGGHQRFPMLCTMTTDGRHFFNNAKKADTTSFLEYIDIVYQNVDKMVLFLYKAPWYTSADAIKFQKHGIVLAWYPRIIHTSIRQRWVWNELKRITGHSIMQIRTCTSRYRMILSGITNLAMILPNIRRENRRRE